MATNKTCIIRLSRYKNALYRLRSLGFIKVFSDNLADAVNVTASQVRKDFSIFGISGNKKGGYQVDALIEKMNSILGKDTVQKVIVAGSGNIGTALTKYQGFHKEGIEIKACFDIDPAKYSRNAAIPILPLDEMKDFIAKNNILLGIISVTDIAAQRVLDMMAQAGIRGILNFAPIQLKAPADCIVTNVNVAVELENLIYFVNMTKKTSK
jgi:redox-sensing transcriptional repressor